MGGGGWKVPNIQRKVGGERLGRDLDEGGREEKDHHFEWICTEFAH